MQKCNELSVVMLFMEQYSKLYGIERYAYAGIGNIWFSIEPQMRYMNEVFDNWCVWMDWH
jgi:hypothetical protein